MHHLDRRDIPTCRSLLCRHLELGRFSRWYSSAYFSQENVASGNTHPAPPGTISDYVIKWVSPGDHYEVVKDQWTPAFFGWCSRQARGHLSSLSMRHYFQVTFVAPNLPRPLLHHADRSSCTGCDVAVPARIVWKSRHATRTHGRSRPKSHSRSS